jgi:hypothetical protein
VGAEGSTDDFAARLGTVDDEQPADFGVEPAFSQIVDQRLHDGGILRRAFDQAERMLVAFTIDAEGGYQDQVVANMQAVNLMTKRSSLDRSDAIHSASRSADSTTNRREVADFEVQSPAITGRSPSIVGHHAGAEMTEQNIVGSFFADSSCGT